MKNQQKWKCIEYHLDFKFRMEKICKSQKKLSNVTSVTFDPDYEDRNRDEIKNQQKWKCIKYHLDFKFRMEKICKSQKKLSNVTSVTFDPDYEDRNRVDIKINKSENV